MNTTKLERRGTDGTQGAQQWQRDNFVLPPVNITETKDGYVLEAEMPGVGKDQLEVLLEGNELTLIGRRAEDEIKAQCVYRESTARDFRRTFVLDPTVDTAKISAQMNNGVLTLTLPKAEKVKPRRIAIGA